MQVPSNSQTTGRKKGGKNENAATVVGSFGDGGEFKFGRVRFRWQTPK
jgi:hypothetical protein